MIADRQKCISPRITPPILTLPVSETDSVLVGATSEIENDTEEQKTDENQDFAGRHPEFDLSKEGDTENVDCQNDSDDDGTGNKRIRFRAI